MRMLAKDPQRRPAPAGRLGTEALALRTTAHRPAAAADPAEDPTGATRVLPPGQVRDRPGHTAAGDRPGGPAPGRAHRDADTDPGFRLPDPAGRPALAGAGPGARGRRRSRCCCWSGRAAATPTGRSRPPTGRRPAEATAPTTVDVAERDYLGRPVADVRTELEGLGLTVDVQRTAGGGPVGTVKGVAPTGTVEAGSLVTLDVVAAAPDQGPVPTRTAPRTKGKGGDKGKGNDKRKGDE